MTRRSDDRPGPRTGPGPSTLSVHGGAARGKASEDPREASRLRGASTPIFPASVYAFPDLTASIEAFTGKQPAYLYSRYAHPTGAAVEGRLAAVEGAESAALLSSGMAAIAFTLLTFCRAGDHLLCTADLYGGTSEFLRRVMPGLGIEVEPVDVDAAGAIAGRVRPATRMILVESPTNPLLKVVDFETLFGSLGAERPLTILDATFATPLGQRAFDAGFDLVVHSATKYIGGHDDLLAGVVSGREELVGAVAETRRMMGAVCDPQTAWLVDRGLKTLALRWERQCSNAGELARRLETHPTVRRVHYPGLPSHPYHAVAARQMRWFGAVLAFDVDGGAAAAGRVHDRLRLILRAPSLGGVESMTLHPATSSHRTLDREERERLGITDGLLRLSVGIEDVEDLWEDLDRALSD